MWVDVGGAEGVSPAKRELIMGGDTRSGGGEDGESGATSEVVAVACAWCEVSFSGTSSLTPSSASTCFAFSRVLPCTDETMLWIMVECSEQ